MRYLLDTCIINEADFNGIGVSLLNPWKY